MNSRFHYLARGIIRHGEHVLLAHQTGALNTFLPGGHIDDGEKAEEALCREIFEELKKNAKIVAFRGAIEHSWIENNIQNYEINLVFEVMVEGLTVSEQPQSLEDHLEFLWVNIDDLERHNLMPSPMIDCIRKSVTDTTAFWGSTLRPRI